MNLSKSVKLGTRGKGWSESTLPDPLRKSRRFSVDESAMEDWARSVDRLIEDQPEHAEAVGQRPWTGQIPLEEVIQTIDHELMRVGFDPTEARGEDEYASIGFESRFLVVRWQDQRFALPLENIREIGKLEHWSSVPLTPSWLLGVTNVRGEILPVIDAGRLFGISEQSDPNRGYIVLARSADDRVRACLLVDGLDGIRMIADDHIQESTKSAHEGGFVSGLASTSSGAMPVLALESLFSSPRFLALTENLVVRNQ